MTTKTASLMTAKTSNSQSWAVIGGGMLGMTLALRLARQGQRVTLFEAAPSLGGLTSAWQIGDVTWDRFYHVVLLSDSNLRRLLEDLDLESELEWVTTRTGFYADGRQYSLSSSWDFLKFPVLNLYQKFRLATTILYAARLKQNRSLEALPVERWLRKLSGDSTFEKIWLPLLRAKLGETYHRTSAAFIWAYIDRMYKARRTGLKREMFGYVPGGYARIIERFLERLQAAGVELQADRRLQVARYDAERQCTSLEFEDRPPQDFDQVLFTIPSPAISRACPQLTTEEHQQHQQIEYLGVVCASVLLKRPFQGYYVTNIIDSWVPLTGIIEMSTIVPPAELNGHSLLYLPKYVEATDEQAFAESDEDIRERFLTTLEKMYANFSRDDVLEFKVARARHVMALPTLDYSSRLPSMKTSIPGIYAINSAQIVEGVLNVNETLEVAERALNDLLLPKIDPANS